MKKKWIVSVEKNYWDEVIKQLEAKRVYILDLLEILQIIIIQEPPNGVGFIKEMPGVLAVEEEGEITIT